MWTQSLCSGGLLLATKSTELLIFHKQEMKSNIISKNLLSKTWLLSTESRVENCSLLREGRLKEFRNCNIHTKARNHSRLSKKKDQKESCLSFLLVVVKLISKLGNHLSILFNHLTVGKNEIRWWNRLSI